jgi:hypothetical protein
MRIGHDQRAVDSEPVPRNWNCGERVRSNVPTATLEPLTRWIVSIAPPRQHRRGQHAPRKAGRTKGLPGPAIYHRVLGVGRASQNRDESATLRIVGIFLAEKNHAPLDVGAGFRVRRNAFVAATAPSPALYANGNETRPWYTRQPAE